jgi:hypothetical protein
MKCCLRLTSLGISLSESICNVKYKSGINNSSCDFNDIVNNLINTNLIRFCKHKHRNQTLWFNVVAVKIYPKETASYILDT